MHGKALRILLEGGIMHKNLKPINDVIFKAIFANKDNQELLKKN